MKRKRNKLAMTRIPKQQMTIDGVSLYEARKSYSMSMLPDMDVYCIFCFAKGKVKDFAIIDATGELEKEYRCPECKVRMTRATLFSSFTAEQLGIFIGLYERFWSRVQNHALWTQRFNQMFSYADRQIFWHGYYSVRPKKEKSVEDNI